MRLIRISGNSIRTVRNYGVINVNPIGTGKVTTTEKCNVLLAGRVMMEEERKCVKIVAKIVRINAKWIAINRKIGGIRAITIGTAGDLARIAWSALKIEAAMVVMAAGVPDQAGDPAGNFNCG